MSLISDDCWSVHSDDTRVDYVGTLQDKGVQHFQKASIARINSDVKGAPGNVYRMLHDVLVKGPKKGFHIRAWIIVIGMASGILRPLQCT